jgi:hypothetical protein
VLIIILRELGRPGPAPLDQFVRDAIGRVFGAANSERVGRAGCMTVPLV